MVFVAIKTESKNPLYFEDFLGLFTPVVQITDAVLNSHQFLSDALLSAGGFIAVAICGAGMVGHGYVRKRT